MNNSRIVSTSLSAAKHHTVDGIAKLITKSSDNVCGE